MIHGSYLIYAFACLHVFWFTNLTAHMYKYMHWVLYIYLETIHTTERGYIEIMPQDWFTSNSESPSLTFMSFTYRTRRTMSFTNSAVTFCFALNEFTHSSFIIIHSISLYYVLLRNTCISQYENAGVCNVQILKIYGKLGWCTL